MRAKLKLDLNDLKVESFNTSDTPAPRAGTVFGHITAAQSCGDTPCCTAQATCPDSHYTGPCQCDTGDWTCQGQNTCFETCATGYCCAPGTDNGYLCSDTCNC